MGDERAVREALRRTIKSSGAGTRTMVDEFWLPRSKARADLAVLGKFLEGYEIKTSGDTLKRLPSQVRAYGSLFDRCTAVVAEKHVEGAQQILPDWWGLMVIRSGEQTLRFHAIRSARRNPAVQAATLVRLLWRDEAMAALFDLGHEPESTAQRNFLWDELLRHTSLRSLKTIVAEAILARDPSKARIPTRRFSSSTPVVAGG
jgi:hypothetical protein